MKIILLNGPPRCGKDTLAELYTKRYNSAWGSFKERLIEITLAIYGVESHIWFGWYEEDKEKPRRELDFQSCREALIFVSEEVIKPKFGESFFGKAAAGTCRVAEYCEYDYIIFSDSGFPEEALPLCNLVGPENVMVVRMGREGTDFSNDSRRYLRTDDLPEGVHFVHLDNNGHIEGTLGYLAMEIEEVWG